MATPVTRQDAATADYHAWLAGQIPDAALVARTAERIAGLVMSAKGRGAHA